MAEAVVSLFSTEQVARILEVSPAEVRRWVRSGLLRPARIDRSVRFDFRDVAASRAVAALTRAGVTPRRIKRSLRQIGEWLPDAPDLLNRLEAGAAGRGLRVRLRSGQAADPSGQLLLDLADELGRARPVEERIVALRPEAGSAEAGSAAAGSVAAGSAAAPDTGGAEAWFEAGMHAEEAGEYEQAVDAYERAVARGAASAEVDFNLGNALYALGRAADAAASYLRAVDREPGYVEAWNNLGNALIDTGRAGEAIDAYRRALALDPHYADAHGNLAEAFAQLGRAEEARRHRQAYLRGASHGGWAEQLRRELLALQKSPKPDPSS